MTQNVFDRRQFTALLSASLFGAGKVRAAIGGKSDASVFSIGTGNAPYYPPTNVTMVAEVYRRMTAPIMVDGQGPFKFIVDTGANQSVISAELAGRLGLATGPLEALNGVAGVQMAPTTVATLDVGKRQQGSVLLSVLPAASIGAEGMLGLDRLDGLQLTLDFRGRTLQIAPSGHWRREGDIAVKAHRRDGQLTLVDADLAGIPLVAFLDSGAQSTIGNVALGALALSRNPGSPWFETSISSATGQQIAARMADLPRLRVGGMGLPNWPVAFADLHTFKMWDLIRKPAIMLGIDVLSRFESVSLDFARNEVRFRLPS